MKKSLRSKIVLLIIFSVLSAMSMPLPAAASPITVIIPATQEKAYQIAGEQFAGLWEKVTGYKPAVKVIGPDVAELPSGDLILIGSDAVNPIVHSLIRSGALETLNIRYNSDNYRMLSLQQDGRTCLILAGGTGRSTLYAVYDFFQREAGVGFFWDADVIPHHSQIELAGIDVNEQPHFEYRGLRYFAHRGLHRFQAEHWDLEDWKREIDWVMKKRFNMFMLRTGIDDLFQRAFPGEVPYPPVNAQDPDAKQRSFQDRTSFWPLKYRGELRKQVLQYARDRGLLNPVDVGTITHWYSATPGSFYQSHPGFPVIKNQATGYSLPSEAIWDIESQKAWDAYWKLTETDIHEFEGGSPRMFHTIGMAERTFGKDARENLQDKLYVYRKTGQMVHAHYPDAPLLVASWDFILWWKDKDVQQLLKEFNPDRTIILDYTADVADKITYRDWGFENKFPWIFGAFHSYDRNSDIHEDYNILGPRLKEAAADSFCKGFVTWSEISHDDTYFLEYVADNSWEPRRLSVADATAHYCKTRYPGDLALAMQPLWMSFLPLSACAHWSRDPATIGHLLFEEPQFRILTDNKLINITPELAAQWKAEYQRLSAGLKQAPGMLKGLATLADQSFEDPLWRRDALDMARTTASRALFAAMAQGIIKMEAWRQKKVSSNQVQQIARLSQDLINAMSDILAMSDDFSMNATYHRLSEAKELNGIQPVLNPHTEQTLKGNAENNYCRSHQYELVKNVYTAEYAAYWKWVLSRIASGDRTAWHHPADFDNQEKAIVDRFYKRSLADMAPTEPRTAEKMSENLLHLKILIEELLQQSNNNR